MSRNTRRLLWWVWLTALWVLLWRDLSVANVVSGAAVGLAVTVAYPLAPSRDTDQRLHVGRLIAFVGFFLWQLLTSNLVVARAVLFPRRKITTGILAVPLAGCSDLVTTVIANSVSLTPGTLTVEVRRDPRTIYVHVLHLRDVEEVRRGMHEMARRVLRALATEQVQHAFEAAIADGPPSPAAGTAVDRGGSVGGPE